MTITRFPVLSKALIRPLMCANFPALLTFLISSLKSSTLNFSAIQAIAPLCGLLTESCLNLLDQVDLLKSAHLRHHIWSCRNKSSLSRSTTAQYSFQAVTLQMRNMVLGERNSSRRGTRIGTLFYRTPRLARPFSTFPSSSILQNL